MDRSALAEQREIIRELAWLSVALQLRLAKMQALVLTEAGQNAGSRDKRSPQASAEHMHEPYFRPPPPLYPGTTFLFDELVSRHPHILQQTVTGAMKKEVHLPT